MFQNGKAYPNWNAWNLKCVTDTVSPGTNSTRGNNGTNPNAGDGNECWRGGNWNSGSWKGGN